MQTQIKFKHHRDYQLGILLLRRNQHMEALERFKAFLNEFPNRSADVLIPIYKHLMLHHDNHHIRIVLAELYISMNQLDEAFNELEDIFEADPRFTQTYFLLNKLFSKNNNKDHIITIFEEAFNLNIIDSYITDTLQNVYLEKNNFEKNILFFSKLIQHNPTSIPHHKTLAKLYELQKNYEKSMEIYQTLTKLSPDLCTEAAHHCEKLLNHDPKNFAIRFTLVSFYIKACKPENAVKQLNEIYKMDKKKVDQTIDQLKHILDLYPNHSETLLFLAECYISKKDYTDATLIIEQLLDTVPESRPSLETLLKEIHTKHPTHIPTRLLQVKYKILKKDYKNALNDLEDIIRLPEIDTDSVELYLKKISTESLEKDRCYFLLATLAFKTHKRETCFHYCDALIGSVYDKDARLFEASLYKESNDLKRCFSNLTQLLEDYPFDPTIHTSLSELIQRLLTQELEESLQKKEQQSSLFKTGLIYLRLGQLLHAIESFQKIPTEDKNHLTSQLLIGRCFLELGKFDMAINQLGRTLTLLNEYENSLKADILFLLSLSHFLNGHYKTGVRHLEEVLEININHQFSKQLLDYFNTQNLIQLRGKALSAYINNDKHFTHISILNTEKHKNKMGLQGFALTQNDQGVEYCLKQNFASAEAEFKLAIQMDPGLTISYSNLSMVYIHQNKFKKAHDILDKGLALNPDLDLFYAHKGFVHYKEGDLDKAIQLFKKAIELSPYNDVFHFNLGVLHLKQGNLKESFSWWEKSSHIGLLSHALHRYVHYLFPESFSDTHWLSFEPFNYHRIHHS